LPQAQAEQLRAQAEQAFESHDFLQAFEKYVKVYPNYPDDYQVNVRLGWLYMNRAQPNYPRAAFHYRQARRVNPSNLDVLRDLAKVLSWLREFDEAAALYRELLEKSPSAQRYWLEFARVLVWAGKGEEAIPHYQNYLNRAPSNFEARNELGQLLAQQRDFAGAMQQYNYVLRFQPENVTARLGLARVLSWSGQVEPGLLEVEKVLQSRPGNFEARVLKAYDLLWLGQIEESKTLFRSLARENPSSRDVQEGLRSIARLEPARPGVRPEPPPAPSTAVSATSLRLAQEAEAQGRFPEAIKHYREHLEEFPRDEEARFRLARVLGWNKQFTESESMLRQWTANHPDSAAGFLQLARVLSWQEKYEPAVEQYRKALSLDPENVEGHIEFARTLSWLKQYTEALAEYRRALDAQPDNREARAGVVRVLLWMGELQEARNELATFRQVHPEDPQADTLLRTIESLETKQEAARAISPTASEEYFRALIEKEPTNVAARLELADLLARREDFPGAVEQLRVAAELKPEDASIGLKLARVLSWNREYAESRRRYRQWLEKYPTDEEVRLELARVLSWGRDFNGSIVEYRQVLETNPRKMDARLELARVLTWQRRYEEALYEFDKVLRQDPENVDAWVGKGRVLAAQSKWRPSLFAYESALRLNPSDQEARIAKAQSLLWSGNGGRARPMLNELRQENPDDARVLVSLASAENSAGRPDRALDLLGEAAALEPQNVEVDILRDQIQAQLRPELRLGSSYGRDTERLNTWRHFLDYRFNIVPRMRHSLRFEFLPSSGPADIFGYPVAAGLFSARVPVEPFVPAPRLLGLADFPPELLLPGSERIRQSAVQFEFGTKMKVNEWFQWAASVGAVVLRHGSDQFPNFPEDRTRFIYSVSPAFRLSPQWQFSLGFARRYLLYTPKSISQTIHNDEQSVTIVYTPDSRSRIALTGWRHRLSPEYELPPEGPFAGGLFRQKGYGGRLTATRILWKVEKAEFEGGYLANIFGYRHPFGLADPQFSVNPGVFTPSFYQRHAGLVRFAWIPSKFLTWDLHGTLGGQQILRGSDFGFSSTAGTRFDFQLAPATTLSLGYEYFNAASALQPLVVPAEAPAYHNHTVTVILVFRF
jgi:tetratricopeptide (TPR) repeat protein